VLPVRPDSRDRRAKTLGKTPSPSDEPTLSERFTAAYHQLSPSVLGYLRSHGVDDPEGATHEVFLALYRTLDRITGGDDDVRTMTFSIAHARVVDHHRARARRPFVVPFDPEADHRLAPSAEETAVASLGETNVFALVGSLSDDQREALLLRVVAGMTLEEAAQVMNKSVGAVKQLQFRALKALRTSWSEGAEDD
jgi:RNA polymerase sigma-70 factor (ECF subfamily)